MMSCGVVMITGSSSSSPSNLTANGNKLFFRAFKSGVGTELWATDGTGTGTAQVKDIRPGSLSSFPSSLTASGGKVFFVANDGTNGSELWVSDGTSTGTKMVKDIRAGSFSSSITILGDLNGKLLFRANDGTKGTEPWISDGTSAGTTLLKDIYSGSSSSFPFNFLTTGSRFGFFVARDATTGTELWKTDGTTAGTSLVADIRPGTNSSTPSGLVLSNGMLIFRATDPVKGTEPFKFFPGANTKMVGHPCSTSATRRPHLMGTDPVIGGTMKLRGAGAKPGAVGVQLLGAGVNLNAIPLTALGAGCNSYINLLSFWMPLSTFGVPASGSWTQNYPVPNDATLKGVRVAFQTWYIILPALQWEMSNGVFSALGN